MSLVGLTLQDLRRIQDEGVSAIRDGLLSRFGRMRGLRNPAALESKAAAVEVGLHGYRPPAFLDQLEEFIMPPPYEWMPAAGVGYQRIELSSWPHTEPTG